MRIAAKKDANHKEIVEAFRLFGWSVLDISQLKNCCDIFVSKNHNTIAVEIKDGSKPPSARKLTPGELVFKDSWKGHYVIVCSVGDVLLLNSRFFGCLVH